jgi:CRISPR type III-A-associated RAMP protein Csm4
MKIARIPLQPFSRFHFGEFKFDVNLGLSATSAFAHSDTLFSALINSYAYINDAGTLVEAFEGDQINISSLFYYLKNGDKLIFFLPKPVFLETDSKFDGYHKLRNKIKFVSHSVWQQGFNQEQWANQDEYKIIQNEFLISKDEYDDFIKGIEVPELKIYKTVQNPKSPIRKNAPDDSIFYQTDVEIADNNV